MKQTLRVKICGITQAEQAHAIIQLGAHALGFICVEASPRYVSPEQIRTIVDAVGTQSVGPKTVTANSTQTAAIALVGVFADASLSTIQSTAAIAGLNAAQLHGSESPDFCQQLRESLPNLKVTKAFRIKTPETLKQVAVYEDKVDGFLLDAYQPNQLGGTGKTLDWTDLKTFRPRKPWFLAGGLTPNNVLTALGETHPDGIDLSSGVERSPGDKDLSKVQQLFSTLQAAEWV